MVTFAKIVFDRVALGAAIGERLMGQICKTQGEIVKTATLLNKAFQLDLGSQNLLCITGRCTDTATIAKRAKH